MAKLSQIEARMDKDMEMIKPTYDDLIGRRYLANSIRLVGFGTIIGGITAIIVHFF